MRRGNNRKRKLYGATSGITIMADVLVRETETLGGGHYHLGGQSFILYKYDIQLDMRQCVSEAFIDNDVDSFKVKSDIHAYTQTMAVKYPSKCMGSGPFCLECYCYPWPKSYNRVDYLLIYKI